MHQTIVLVCAHLYYIQEDIYVTQLHNAIHALNNEAMEMKILIGCECEDFDLINVSLIS